ncbi:MAG: cytochrome P450 [Propionicimonas sp.]
MSDHTVAERPEILGHAAVRAAAKDTETYSSDLQGDRDVRSYRQLPLEADPPRHTLFREALQPLFMGAAIAPHVPEFEALARRLITDIDARGGGEIGAELALPYVMGCLTIIYNRPQDFDEWVSWGPDVWTAEAYAKGELTPESHRALRERNFDLPSQRSGATLQAYLERVFTAAEQTPDKDPAEFDVWDQIARLEVSGSPVTRDEMYGMANVLLAGGRDTVIKLTTGIVWHLINRPEDRIFLAENPDSYNKAIGELARYLSPLPKMERVRRDPAADGGEEEYVLLSYVSANHDRSVWPDADRLDLHRPRKPHLAFGFGRHSCMGMNITEHEAKAFLNVLVNEWPGWEFDGEPEIAWATEPGVDGPITVIDRFEAVRVRVGR